jgi:hypothetical protein
MSEAALSVPEEKPVTRPISPTRRIEFKLNLLIYDLQGDARLSMLGLALVDKLFGVKLYRELCKRATEECSSIFLKEKEEKSRVLSRVGTSRAYAAAHFEAFLYFIVGTFDVLASITLYLYPKHAKTLTDRYFKDQMKTFINNPNMAPEYAALLTSNENWVEDVHNNRDGLAHKASAFLVFEDDGTVQFEKRRPYDDRGPFTKKDLEDLLKYLDEVLKSLYDFLDKYVEIHRKQVPVSDRSKLLLGALERGEVLEYYV